MEHASPSGFLSNYVYMTPCCRQSSSHYNILYLNTCDCNHPYLCFAFINSFIGKACVVLAKQYMAYAFYSL